MQHGSLQFSLSNGTSTRFGGGRIALPPVAGGSERLAVYAEHWLEGVREGVRPRTFHSYSSQLRLHVLPLLGDRTISELSVEDVLELITGLRQAGYTGWTIRTALTPLSRLLNHAVRRGVIQVSPMARLDRTERPAVWAAEQKILTREEIGRLLEGAPPRYGTLLATAVFTGLRQGELLGLKWSEVDFGEGVVKVRKSLDRQGHRLNPKTRHAMRDVVVMPALARTLQAHRNASPFPGASDFVFASQRGTPLYWRNVARRALQPALRNAGLEHLRWHDLRHTFASLLISGGANIVYVSRQMGHGSSDITLRCYGHLFDQAEHAQRTRNALEDSFGDLLSGASPLRHECS